MLAAQIYYQSNKLDKALSILNNPYLDENASDENLTLAASIAQQLKRWPAAMENYQQLVSRQQNNPQWLLGLAISQDAQQMASKALKNYQKLIISKLFYFILYLCALEIAPYLVIYKLLIE